MFKRLLRIQRMVTLIVIMVFSEVSSAQEQEEKAKGPEAFELGEVIVTEEKPVVNLATTVSEVTAEDIEARGAETVADALQLIPGVKIDAGGKGEQKVRIRDSPKTRSRCLSMAYLLTSHFTAPSTSPISRSMQ